MFVGNNNTKRLLLSLLQSQKLPHMLFTGPKGHGKTTLVRLLKRPTHEFDATAIEDHNDLYACLKSLQSNQILFLDEIHALAPKLQEALYQVMDKNVFYRISGRGSQKNIESIKIPQFTLIGATTKEYKLNPPFLQRFLQIQLEDYSDEDILQMTKMYFNTYQREEGVDLIISQYSRSTPRLVVQLTNLFKNLNLKTEADAKNMVKSLNLFPQGLTRTEVLILQALKKERLSSNSLASILSLDEETIKSVHEPFLLRKGFISITKHGREISIQGQKYLFAGTTGSTGR